MNVQSKILLKISLAWYRTDSFTMTLLRRHHQCVISVYIDSNASLSQVPSRHNRTPRYGQIKLCCFGSDLYGTRCH